jgi:hypothetical protein
MDASAFPKPVGAGCGATEEVAEELAASPESEPQALKRVLIFDT